MFFLWIKTYVTDTIILTAERLTINRAGREYIIIEYDYELSKVVVRFNPQWTGYSKLEIDDISALLHEYQKYLDSMK